MLSWIYCNEFFTGEAWGSMGYTHLFGLVDSVWIQKKFENKGEVKGVSKSKKH